jgi:hypothetical protein
MEEKQMKQAQEQAQLAAQDKQAQRDFEMKKHDDEIAVKREQIQANLELGSMREMGSEVRHQRDNNARIDTDKNGIDDFLDLRRTDIDENYKNEQVRLEEEKLAETQRANMEREAIQRAAIAKKPTSSK